MSGDEEWCVSADDATDDDNNWEEINLTSSDEEDENCTLQISSSEEKDPKIKQNILFSAYVTNSDKPKPHDFVYGQDIYPNSYKINELILCTSITQIDDQKIKIKQDELYYHHTILAATYYLQDDIIKRCLMHDSKLIKFETAQKALELLCNCSTYYHYCVNSGIYISIFQKLLEYIKLLDSDIEMTKIIQLCANQIDIINTHGFGGIRFNMKFHPEKFDEYPCVGNMDLLIECLKSYDSSQDNDLRCKYCLCSCPVDKLVTPCLCKNPVHISCFIQWYNDEHKSCEICHDNFSRLNQKRITTGMIVSKEDSTIFFPFDNFYPIPLMTSSTIRHVTNKREQLTLALCYLQYNVLKKLLEEYKVKGEIIEFSDNMLYYFQKGSMPSNYLKSKNRAAYQEIAQLLKQYNIL